MRKIAFQFIYNIFEQMKVKERETVLITGGAGFFGHHIASRFIKAGARVVIVDKMNAETTDANEKAANLDRLRQLAKTVEGASVEVYQSDILESEAIAKCLQNERPVICVHVASMVDDRRSVKYPTEYLETNVIGTQKLLQAIVDHGSVKQVVYISTRSTYGQVADPGLKITESQPLMPINPYGASKVGAEAILHTYHHLYGLHVNIIKIFALYGPYGRPDMIPRQLIEKVHHGAEIVKFGSGEATRDWLYVKDAADAVHSAAYKPLGFEDFNIGSGEATSLNALIAAAEEVVGRPAVIRHATVPKGDANFVGVADYSKAEKMLGWKPRTSLMEGLKRTLSSYLKQEADVVV
jgi:UDP-glucuronate 4-epimerase